MLTLVRKETIDNIMYLLLSLSLSLIVSLSSLIVPKFLQSLKELGDVDEEAISEAHLRTEYGKIQEQVRHSIRTILLYMYMYICM